MPHIASIVVLIRACYTTLQSRDRRRLVDGDVTESQLLGQQVVYGLDADVAAVDRPHTVDVLVAGHRQLQRTPGVLVEAASSRQRRRPVADTHVYRVSPTCQCHAPD